MPPTHRAATAPGGRRADRAAPVTGRPSVRLEHARRALHEFQDAFEREDVLLAAPTSGEPADRGRAVIAELRRLGIAEPA